MNTTPRKYYEAALDMPAGGGATPSGKKLTPMAKILKWVDEKYPNFNKADIEEYITSLLPEEREMAVNSRQDGIDGMMNGYTISNDEYFTNNYQQ